MSIPIIRRSTKEIGALAKTDFSKIYVAEDVSKKEYDVLVKHEKAHIWCEHNRRFVKGYNPETWNIACDVEIARNIYDEKDEAVIKAPFSKISRIYVSDSFKDMPKDLLLAEDIYDWLLKNEEDMDKGFSDILENLTEGRSEKEREEIVKELLELAKEALEKEQASEVADEKTKLALEEIKRRKPSLSSEIDAALRYRFNRKTSYRRPSRREDPTFLLKGRITELQPPLVEIFLDRSGSFTPEKTAKAQEVLGTLLRRYGASIRQDVWFFGSGKISDKDFAGGDTPYHLVHEHISKTKPVIAIVVTDDDPVSDVVKKLSKQRIVCVPVGCSKTQLAEAIGGVDVLCV